MVPELLHHVRERADDLSRGLRLGVPMSPVERWGLPTEKELSASSRKREAAALRLAKLAAPWRTRLQLDALSRSGRQSGERFRFAVLGDAEPGRFWIFRKLFNRQGVFETQLRRVQASSVDFSMQLGDMVSRGIQRNYLRFFRQLGRNGVRIPYLTTIGNHDRRFPHGRCDADYYRSFFGPTNYLFDHAGIRFVSLDTSLQRVTPRQLAWLDRALDAPGRKIVFTHVPPAGLGEWTRFAGAQGVGGFKTGAARMMSLFSKHRVDRVYMGHIHAFGVQDVDGVRYVLSGGGGSPLFPVGKSDVFHHFLTVEVGPDGVTDTLHPLHGRPVPLPKARVLLSR
jgi:3',5'-cyclic AMP phosphodiesterase CpdA